jgi:plasmid stabilization system protein ParE
VSLSIHWSDTAVEHLADIARHISRTSPVYAARVVDRILGRVEPLSDFPQLGPRAAEAPEDEDVRELFQAPYRIVYLAQATRIDILAVVHGRRDFEWRG